MYHGKPTDLSTGKRTAEKGLAMRVVNDLVRPFVGLSHVIYCDNFYSNGPLLDMLAKDSIFLIGTIKKCVCVRLKSAKQAHIWPAMTTPSLNYMYSRHQKKFPFRSVLLRKNG